MKKKLFENKYICFYFFILFAIIVIQIIYISFIFTLKDGHHSDEVYNYGYANSYNENGFLGTSNINKWVDSSFAKGFITVGYDQRFSYDAVLKNTANELNPPFQIFVLHTLCSFFPEHFSWNYCFAINILSFLLSQMFLYALARDITNNALVSYAVVILYGFCVGAMDITIFMRIYAMAVMFSIVFAYYSNKIYINRNNKCSIYNYILLFISCFLGCYTLHLFLFFAFCIACSYSIYYLFTKNIKKLFIYGFSVLGAALVSLALVPSTISHIDGTDSLSVSMVKYPTNMQLRLYWFEMTRDLFGLHVSSVPNPYLEYFLIFLFALIIFLIPLFILFRKEKWFKKFILNSKNWLIDRLKRIKNIQFSLIVYFITCVSSVYLAADQTSIYQMGIYSNRYLFIIYPIFVLLCVCSTYLIINLINDNKRIKIFSSLLMLVLGFVFAIWSQLSPNSMDYLFIHNKEGISFDKIESGSNVVLMLGQDWKIVCFAPDLINTNSYYFTDFSRFKENLEIFNDIDISKPMYLIIDDKFIIPDDISYDELEENPLFDSWSSLSYYERELIDFYGSLNHVDSIKKVGKDQQMSTDFNIYRVYFK